MLVGGGCAVVSDAPVVEGFTDLVEVGRGGFSRVFAAYQVAFDRRVAIKVLNDRLADDASVAAFERECQAMGALSRHPFIVTVLASAFTSDYRPCIVMDLFERGNYMQLVRRHGPIPLEELLSVGVRVAGALATAHQDGVIHGDVKPQNIFKSAFGFPALGDFGIATLRRRAVEQVGLGMSPHFVAPELIEGGAAAAVPPADQYSLGATLYTLAAGRRPFESDQPLAPQQILEQALDAPTPTLPERFPRELGAALRRAMAREPRNRFPDLAAFAVALANIEHRLGYRPTAIPIAGIDDDATIAVDEDTVEALRGRTTDPTLVRDVPAPGAADVPGDVPVPDDADAPTIVLPPAPPSPPEQPPTGGPPPEQPPTDRPPPGPRRPRRILIVVLALLAAPAIVVPLWLAGGSGSPVAAPPEPPASTAPPPELTPPEPPASAVPPPESTPPEPPFPPPASDLPPPAEPAPSPLAESSSPAAEEPSPPTAEEPLPLPPEEPSPPSVDDAEPYRAVILFPGRVDDESWSNAWWDGARAAMEFWPDVTVAPVESVYEEVDYWLEGLDYAGEGFDLVLMAHSAMTNPAAQVATAFPDVQVCVASVDPPPELLDAGPPNLCFIDIAQHHANFFTGVLAALITETGHIGALGGFNIPALASQLETFHLGARCVNPDIEFTQEYIQTWDDLDLAEEAAHALIAEGVDVIQSATEQAISGIIVAAIEAGNQVWVIPALYDRYEFAPRVVLSSALQGLADAARETIRRDRGGTIAAHSVLRFTAYNTPGISAAPLRDPALSALGADDLDVYEDFRRRVQRREIRIPDETTGDNPVGLEVGIGGRIDLADIGC